MQPNTATPRPSRRNVSAPDRISRGREPRATNNVRRPQPRQNFGRRNIARGALQDVVDTIKRALNRPAVVLVLVAVAIFWVDHYDKSGFVHRKCDGSTSPLCKWLISNFEQFAGLVVFVPALYDLPQNVMLTAAIVSIGAIFLLPAMELWVYAAAAFALHTYFTSRVTTTRIIVIIAAVVVFLVFRQ